MGTQECWAYLIIGVFAGAILNAIFQGSQPPKPPFRVTVSADPDVDDGRVLVIEGGGPDGAYQGRDLFFAASILAYRTISDARPDPDEFEDGLETFADCVRDVRDSIASDPDSWM